MLDNNKITYNITKYLFHIFCHQQRAFHIQEDYKGLIVKKGRKINFCTFVTKSTHITKQKQGEHSLHFPIMLSIFSIYAEDFFQMSLFFMFQTFRTPAKVNSVLEILAAKVFLPLQPWNASCGRGQITLTSFCEIVNLDLRRYSVWGPWTFFRESRKPQRNRDNPIKKSNKMNEVNQNPIKAQFFIVICGSLFSFIVPHLLSDFCSCCNWHVFCLVDFGDSNWWQFETCNLLLARTVDVLTLRSNQNCALANRKTLPKRRGPQKIEMQRKETTAKKIWEPHLWKVCSFCSSLNIYLLSAHADRVDSHVALQHTPALLHLWIQSTLYLIPSIFSLHSTTYHPLCIRRWCRYLHDLLLWSLEMYLARANYKHRLRKRKALEQKRLTRRNILWIIWLNAFFPKRASTKLTAHDAYVTFFKRNRKKVAQQITWPCHDWQHERVLSPLTYPCVYLSYHMTHSCHVTLSTKSGSKSVPFVQFLIRDVISLKTASLLGVSDCSNLL